MSSPISKTQYHYRAEVGGEYFELHVYEDSPTSSWAWSIYTREGGSRKPKYRTLEDARSDGLAELAYQVDRRRAAWELELDRIEQEIFK